MKRTLLVIDVQNEYFPGGGLPLWQAELIEARTVEAIGLARAAGDQIILIQHIAAVTSELFAEGSTGAAIRPRILASAPDAPIVIKRHADAFQETNLIEHLSATTELLICGMMTQNCIVFTAMSRAAEVFQVKTIGDLCTAPTEIIHLISMAALLSKGQTVTSSDLWT